MESAGFGIQSGISLVDSALCSLPARPLQCWGGANSIDFASRTAGVSWWPEESISEADLKRLDNLPADVLFGHEAPLGLDAQSVDDGQWTSRELEYAHAGRVMFHRGFLSVRPRLSVSGHYHRHIDELCQFTKNGEAFTTRVVVLDMGGSATRVSQVILDVETLELAFLMRNGIEVQKFDGPSWSRT